MFGEAFMQRALTAGSIIAAACAYLGIFVIWRRIVFLSVALSEVAALGVAIGFFFGQTSFLMAFLLTTVVTLIFWQLWHQQRGFGEAAVGFIYALCAAASVLLVAKNPLAEARGLDLVSGNILYISTPELLVLSLVSLAVVGSQIVFRKEFVAVTFDRDFALSLGLPAGFWDLIFYL
ncbi:MAG TPA: metal ABC transporter permease, partial [bacterium]|nr:metal ABC transporter permease [bacterium]